MKTGQSSSTGISGWPWTIVFALTLGLGGFIAQTLPLKSERPPVPATRRFEFASVQALPARLPEDPFEAADRESPPSANGTDSDRVTSVEQIQGAIRCRLKSSSCDAGPPKSEAAATPAAGPAAGSGGSVRVIGVMMFAGGYPEDAEGRRRGRYAVIAGLKEEGFGPMDAEHLGLATVSLPGTVSSPARPLRIPFEWFEGSGEKAGAGLDSSVLVLYLEDDAFGEQSIARLNALWSGLLGPLKPSVVPAPRDTTSNAPPAKNPAGLSLTLIGPAGTGTLLAIARGIAKGEQVEAPMTIYSPWATASEAGAPSANPNSEAAAVLRAFRATLQVPGYPLRFYRTIGGDDRLVDALWTELKRRGISFNGPQDGLPVKAKIADSDSGVKPEADAPFPCRATLVIVAELDTDYANLIADEFQSRIDKRCITLFRYMRGIDGLTGKPRSTDSATPQNAAVQASDPTQLEAAFASGRYLESSDGPAQTDYLRRLAYVLAQVDRGARAAGGEGIRAVGIIGSDVYDKLLVLQALRPAFGNALFFTTDLDIRLTQSAANNWARNFLVASNYALSLTPRVQGGAPPFRDAYQTSAFIATRMALGVWHRPLLQAVRNGFDSGGDPGPRTPVQLYEIGRTVAISLEPTTAQSIDAAVFAPLDPFKTVFRLRPVVLGMLVFLAAFALAAMTMKWPIRILAALFPALVADHSLECAEVREEQCFVRRANRGRVLAVVIAIAVLIALFIVATVRTGPGSEPLYLFQGVSGWSVEFLRALAIIAGGWMMFEIWVGTRSLAFCIENKLRLPAKPGAQQAVNGSRRARLRRWMAGPDRPFAAQAGSSEGARYWGELLLRWTPREAIKWISAVTLAGALIGWLLDYWLIPPPPWVRDPVLVHIDWILQGIDSVAGAALVSAVVYVTRLARGFVTVVTENDNQWPAETVRAVATADELPPDGVADWIDFLIVKNLTRQVSLFVYFPFVFLLLVIVVRSPLFDAGGLPVSFGIVATILLAYAWHSAFVLRKAAAATRAQAIHKYEQRLMQLFGNAGSAENELQRSGRVAQYQLILERMRGTREGIYSSFVEQPFLRSLFIPIGGIGGLQLIDALSRL